MLTPQLPYPPDQGAPIRNWNFIRYLGSCGRYDVTLLSFARPGEHGTPGEATATTSLAQYCSRVEIIAAPPSRSKLARLRTLLKVGRPDLAMRLASPVFTANLKYLLETQQFDAILCEGLELAPFIMAALSNTTNRPRLILDEHNAEWLLQQRAYINDRQAGYKRLPAAAYSYLQAYRLRQFEAQALNFFDRAIAVSSEDKAALEKIKAVGAKISVIPNGIDLSEFSLNFDVPEEVDSLVFTGTMDFRPNIDAVTWFVREIWPLIKLQKPQAKFTIVGRRPSAAVQALAQTPGVIVTGSVPDARPYVWSSAVYVVPMRIGGGVRFKVLEALAMGKAVVTTPMGVDGIALTPGHDAEVATLPQQFAQAVVQLLNDPARRAELGRQHGREFVAAHFDWNKLTPSLDSVLLK